MTLAAQPSMCPQCRRLIDAGAGYSFCPDCRFPLMLLAGKYRLERVLAEGGFGTAYFARHIGLDEDADRVVKVVKAGILADPSHARRFRREVQITASLSARNPHIVRIYDDFGEVEGLGAYYVMEYVYGQSLAALMAAEGLLPRTRVFFLFEQLCDAMRAAHRAGIVHRDLKPANVLLAEHRGEPELVKVIDFGLARAARQSAHSQQSGEVLGTPAYISPEQARGEAVDARSDVYAMGAMLYEMLTGAPPFRPKPHSSNPSLDLVLAHRDEPAVPMRLRRPDLAIPEALDEVVMRALAKAPEARYRDAGVLWEAAAATLTEGLAGTLRADPIELEMAAMASAAREPLDDPASLRTLGLGELLEPVLDLAVEPVSGREHPSVAGRPVAPPAPPVAEPRSIAAPGPPTPPRTNLEAPASTFIGRDADLNALDHAFAGGARLVTILGPGGVGKTRLAQEYARRILGNPYAALPASARIEPTPETSLLKWRPGIWFADLSRARDLPSILAAVSRALDVPLVAGDTDPVAALGRVLANRSPLWLILDNFEQVVERAPATLAVWLGQAPDARFLVTSRERLRLDGEQLIDLAPLSDEDGQKLFLERARAVQPGYASADSERQAVADIVRQLDGIPLAIELCAARARLLAPASLRQRIDARFDLLKSQRRDAPDRQATLERTLDWSWDLLAPWERDALAQCAVFRGGFALDAAEAVLDLSAHAEAPEVLDVLEALRDKSLLRSWWPAELGGELRLGMYESIHAYARRKLAESGQEAELRQRHAEHMLSWAEGMGARIAGGHQLTEVRRLALEMDNLQVVYRWAIDSQPELASWAVLALEPVFSARGPFEAYLDQVDRALAADVEAPPERRGRLERARVAMLLGLGRLDEAETASRNALEAAQEAGSGLLAGQALADAGIVEMRRGKPDQAREYLQTALQGFRRLRRLPEQALVLRFLCMLEGRAGRLQGIEPMLDEALQLARRAQHRPEEAAALVALGNLCSYQGRLGEAQTHYELALAAQQEIGNRRGEAVLRGNAAYVLYQAGRLNQARAMLRRAQADLRELGDRIAEGVVLGNLGAVCMELGLLEKAQRYMTESLDIDREAGARWGEALSLANLAEVHIRAGQHAAARKWLDEALKVGQDSHDHRTLAYLAQLDGDLALDRGDVDVAQTHFAVALSKLGGIGDRVAASLTQLHIGFSRWLRRDPAGARAAFELAETGAVSTGAERILGFARALLAMLDAAADDIPATEARLEAAERCFDLDGDGPAAAMFELACAHRDLARARRAERAGNPVGAESHRMAARKLFETVDQARSVEGQPLTASSLLLRVALAVPQPDG